MSLSKKTTDQIRKEADDYAEGWGENDDYAAYKAGAERWAVWKEKADAFEKALKEINEMSVCYNAIAIATKALEQWK